MSAIERHIILASPQETARFAEALAAEVTAGDCIALCGEVGAGKTTFAQAFIGSLLATAEPVTSPTFTLMQHYPSRHGWPLVHADLYRLKNEVELAELGFDEWLGSSVSLIEWPQIAQPILPADTLYLTLAYRSECVRELHMRGSASRWQHFLQETA